MEVAKANTTGGSFRLTSPERAPNDLMDGEWALVEPLIPPAKRGGNKRTANVREVVDGLMCVPEHRLLVAGHSQGPVAAFDGLRLFGSVELGWDARPHPRRALRALSRGRPARGEPDRRNHRQPERQERGKRGSCIDPPGYASIPFTLRKLCNPA